MSNVRLKLLSLLFSCNVAIPGIGFFISSLQEPQGERQSSNEWAVAVFAGRDLSLRTVNFVRFARSLSLAQRYFECRIQDKLMAHYNVFCMRRISNKNYHIMTDESRTVRVLALHFQALILLTFSTSFLLAATSPEPCRYCWAAPFCFLPGLSVSRNKECVKIWSILKYCSDFAATFHQALSEGRVPLMMSAQRTVGFEQIGFQKCSEAVACSEHAVALFRLKRRRTVPFPSYNAELRSPLVRNGNDMKPLRPPLDDIQKYYPDSLWVNGIPWYTHW